MEYFNTVAMKRVFEFMMVLENYGKHCDSKVQIFWYASEDDEDSKETGAMLKKEIPSLEIVVLDEGQWKRMNK